MGQGPERVRNRGPGPWAASGPPGRAGLHSQNAWRRLKTPVPATACQGGTPAQSLSTAQPRSAGSGGRSCRPSLDARAPFCYRSRRGLPAPTPAWPPPGCPMSGVVGLCWLTEAGGEHLTLRLGQSHLRVKSVGTTEARGSKEVELKYVRSIFKKLMCIFRLVFFGHDSDRGEGAW